MKSICIITSSHLCRNPRVLKEANTLSKFGYDVTVLSPILSEELEEEDRRLIQGRAWQQKITIDLRPSRSGFRHLVTRGLVRAGRTGLQLFGWELPDILGYGTRRVLKIAKSQSYDLYIAHQELGSWVGCELLKDNKIVGADFEDWYSRDLLPEVQATRPLRLLRECENYLLNHCSYITTTSQAMAVTLAETYSSPKPAVIYNCFPWSDRKYLDMVNKDRKDQTLLSIHWVSQTIGTGRGLETLCKALHSVDIPVQVHIRGGYTPSVEQWLHNLFPHSKGHQLYLHDLVPPNELLSRIAEHDVGLALELKEPDNKNFTISNKLFHYLLAGLAIIATDTAGQSEIASVAATSIKLIPSENANALAAQLNNFLSESPTLVRAKEAALMYASNHYCWEKQSPVLLNSVELALKVGH